MTDIALQALVDTAKIGVFGWLATFLWRARKQSSRLPLRIQPPAAYEPLPDDPLIVESETFCDASEPDQQSHYSYFYSGTHFHFRCGTRWAGGRTYDDEPFQMSIWIAPPQEPPLGAGYAAPPYGDPMLRKVVDHLLREMPDRLQVTMLCSEGYVVVDVGKALER